MRYKEFNPNRVLEKCIPQFWKTGFRGTAISDIVELTGVNRFSLYEEFGSKEGILYAALRLYKDRYSNQNLEILQRGGSIKDVLSQFYLSFLSDSAREGCFIIHVGTELADSDEEIRNFVRHYIDEIQELFMKLLSTEYSPKESEYYARHLVGLFYTSISFCLVQSENYRVEHIRNGIDIILDKQLNYA